MIADNYLVISILNMNVTWNMMRRVIESFDSLPLACLINEKFIAVHGGISPDVRKINEINKINQVITF